MEPAIILVGYVMIVLGHLDRHQPQSKIHQEFGFSGAGLSWK